MDASNGSGSSQLTRSSSPRSWSLGNPIHRTLKTVNKKSRYSPSLPRASPSTFCVTARRTKWWKEERDCSPSPSPQRRPCFSGCICCWNVNQHPFRETELSFYPHTNSSTPCEAPEASGGDALLAMTFAILLGPNHSCLNTVDMKTFSTSVQKAYHFCSRYYFQDVHWRQLHAALPPTLLRISPRPPTHRYLFGERPRRRCKHPRPAPHSHRWSSIDSWL